MDTENSIIPLCLYSNNQFSHITLPQKTRENDFTVYKCPPRTEMNFIMLFYVINPDLKPKPTYTDLIGIKNISGETISISSVYDPFNIDDKISIRCLVWLETTPNTTPLYITTNGSNLYVSPYPNQPNETYIPYKIPIIHVLTNNDTNFPKTPSSFGKFKKENGTPLFTFSNSYGKCIPNPYSNLTIGQCMVLYNKNISTPEYIGKYPNILTYLENTYGSNKRNFSKISIIGIVLLCIVLLSILSLFWRKKMYNKY